MNSNLLPATERLEFHHVGVVSSNIARETGQLAVLGYHPESEEFTDPLQGVRGLFLGGQSPRLELLSPLDSPGVLEPWIKSKSKLYHLAYQTPDLPQTLAELRTGGAKLVVEPVPAVAFAGRPIAFVMLPNMLLVELIGTAPAGGGLR
jgi:methylmalonyl-CoA/ethylmalonyl-CoA epimerase